MNNNDNDNDDNDDNDNTTSTTCSATLLSLPNIVLSKISSSLDNDIDRIWLYYTCKRLNNKRMLTLQSLKYCDQKHQQAQFKSLVQCATHIKVSQHLYAKLLNRLGQLEANNESINLKSLKITGYSYGQLDIPPYIERLKINDAYMNVYVHKVLPVLPPNLVELNFGPVRGGSRLFLDLEKTQMPPSLRVLGSAINMSGGEGGGGVLPHGLETLHFGYAFNETLQVGVLPSTLRDLRFSMCYCKILEKDVIPFGVETLHIGGHDKSSPLMSTSIPHSVTHLDLSLYVYQLRMGIIPPSVIHLVMPKSLKGPLDLNVIPHSPALKTVIFALTFNSPIKPGTFCDTIERIEFGDLFQHPLSTSNLPKNLRLLGIASKTDIETIIPLPPSVHIIRFQSDVLRKYYPSDPSHNVVISNFKGTTIYTNRYTWASKHIQFYLNDLLVTWLTDCKDDEDDDPNRLSKLDPVIALWNGATNLEISSFGKSRPDIEK
ncbi:hypothetical protein DFA_07721 [Cavenderia fasciculata]|uniref:FNIP repeat-containing protein n=1 Tax=Cavenderia fasciculata TaxID=261658 RepID=F4Q2W7_CACFS|nr:uncharacterized protein DFA_07721 [Cavenderia fasciculata]EGG16743.1 hypothetical protein DFA_07721 [Cavenderia fasciculata]|eukprot:XP_004355217.1 hypothetical protein DFA_07721 [Cavenderia fasciculata]